MVSAISNKWKFENIKPSQGHLSQQSENTNAGFGIRFFNATALTTNMP
jgi:hypothetical protein